MGSRGGGGPRRNRKAETDAFLKAVKEDKSISDITRKELISQAEGQLGSFSQNNSREIQLTKEINQLRSNMKNAAFRSYRGDQTSKTNKLKELEDELKGIKNSGGTFDKGAAGLRKDLDAAREGRAPKFRYRQALEKKRELMLDRPGQKQLIFSR